MATKLTRCICGKIYDPAENSLCPACGAEPRNEVPPAQQPPPPEPAPATAELRVPQLESAIFPKPLVRATKRGIQVNLTADHLGRIVAGLLVVTGVVAGIWWLLHRPDDKTAGTSAKTELATEKKGNPSGGKTASNDKPQNNPEPNPEPNPKPKPEPQPEPKQDPNPKPEPDPKPKPTPAPQPGAAKTWVADAENGPGTEGADLTAIIEKADDGDTITLKPGTYTAGFTLDKKIRIAGEKAEPDKFVITTKGQKRPTRITAVGATLANLQFVQDESKPGPAFMVEKDSELTIEGCELKLSHTVGIMGRSAAILTMTNCSFTTGAAKTLLMRGPSKVTMTQCSFTGGTSAISADKETQMTLRGCKFTDIGVKEGKESAVSIFGTDASITAEDCVFSGCRMPLQAEEGASLTLTKCTLTGNGVRGEKGDFTKGVIAVSKKATLTLKDVTFEKNMQGINLFQAGTAQIEDCKFTNGGLMLQDVGFMHFCVPLRIYGEGAKAAVRRSTFTQSKPYAIFMEDGASVSVDDSDFASTQLTAIYAGKTEDLKPGSLNEVAVKKSRFTENYEGISLNAAKGMVDECEFRNNVGGLSASGADSTANVSGGLAIGQKDFAFLITSDAALTTQGVKFEENHHGLQIGVANEPLKKATASLEECKFSGSIDADILAYQPSKVKIRLCEFNYSGAAKVKREKGAVIESEPPLLGIVDFGKGVSGKETPSKGGGSTASNNKGTSPKGRSTPSRGSRPDPVRDIINAVDKMKRLFR
jgi:hypothetical protein